MTGVGSFADAKIDGNTVIVSNAPYQKKPMAVRDRWANNP